MNRKNTILIAVLINAGLLAVLFIVAITMQEEPFQETLAMKEEPVEWQLPKLEESQPIFHEVASLNLSESLKQIDEPILVHKLPPLAVDVSTSSPVVTPVAPPQITASPPPLQSASLNEVIVKKGDSLEKIARNHHTTVDEIIKLNHLPSTFLKIGQVIKIPAEKTIPKVVEKKSLEQGPEYYTMKVGENPWAIAQRHHMKVDELLRLNGLNEEKARKLKPGDRLRVK